MSRELRLLNILRTVPEDPRIALGTSSERHIERFYANPPRDVDGILKSMPKISPFGQRTIAMSSDHDDSQNQSATGTDPKIRGKTLSSSERQDEVDQRPTVVCSSKLPRAGWRKLQEHHQRRRRGRNNRAPGFLR
ncbi:Uncharacterized protein Fot_12043 [Forsythia ovata]|uniref:Uncharacterized protein n=1 Tax=Forsythia ovata TaxID=205694 RepID=A0ABD1WLE0_9LAMI